MNRAHAVSPHAKKAELLAAVFTLCGLDPTLNSLELARLVDQSRQVAESRIRKLKPGRIGTVDLDALGHVVYRWLRVSKYLDNDGRPLRLPMRAQGPSLQSLFRETGHKNYFPLGVQHLRDVGRVKKTRNG